MEIVFDFSFINQFAQSPFAFILWVISRGWVFFVFAFLIFVVPQFYLYYIRGKYDKTRSFTLLAIDIPKDNEQSPKAVEHIFTQLSAIPSNSSFYDKWIDGLLPESFSFEIVSMGGYIQFLIHTPSQFRDLVEAAVYAQYPDAEIVEVEDYAQKTRGLTFPNEDYKIWTTEFDMTGKEYYPIRTYPSFEHSLSQEFKDPLAALTEALSKLTADEQVWLQLVITPASDKWKEGGENLVKKLIGEEVKVKKNVFDKISDVPINLISALGDINNLFGVAAKSEKKESPNKVQYLTPGQKNRLESIEMKISKIGFYTKFRMVYIARKSAFNKARGVVPVVGAIKQFNIIGSNGFKTGKNKSPNVEWFFKETRNNYRRNFVLRQFRNRGRLLEPGYYGKILNVEELASIYHFPVITVRTPLVKRTEAKKAEPPTALPITVESALPVALPTEEMPAEKSSIEPTTAQAT